VKIAFVCQYFVPEIGAPSARVSELSREWVRHGHDVTVVTGLPNHPTGIIAPDYRGTIFRRETLDGITVLRNWLYATPNEGFVRRTVAHMSFMMSAMILTTPRLRGHDVIVVSSPTFFAVIAAWFMSRVWRIPYVFEVRDLWPGIFIELGVLKNRSIIRLLEGIEMFLYRRAARVVVVTDSFRDILLRRGLPDGHVSTITNGVDCEAFRPGPRENGIRRTHALSGRFVVLYIGAHGISQALSAILESASALRDDPDVVFVFVGEGAERRVLMEKADRLELPNVRFLPGQPREAVQAWYAAADVVLVPLRNIPLFETFIPSKMFEVMACGRPIIGSVKGEARAVLERSGGAIVVDPEDSAAIARAIRRLAEDRALGDRLGEAGSRFVRAHYDRRVLARRYLDLLQAVVGRTGHGS
jgi:glycosyltransferase involved in cell wall biosynthesis